MMATQADSTCLVYSEPPRSAVVEALDARTASACDIAVPEIWAPDASQTVVDVARSSRTRPQHDHYQRLARCVVVP